MSFRAVILGVLGAVGIATVGYFNDQIPRLEHFVGHQFPLAVFFPLLLLCGVVNPLVRPARWRLRAGELAVMVALWLVACNIPGSGLLRMWSRDLAMPLYYQQQRLDWTTSGAVQKVPPRLFPNDGQYDERFVASVYTGEGQGHLLKIEQVPWDKWADPIRAWMPMVVALAVASICLAVMVHRPWAENERLPYPVAQLALSIMEADPERALGPVFRQRPFLVGAAIVFAMHLVNGSNVWFDNKLIEIPTQFWFPEITQAFPRFGQVPWGGNAATHLNLLPAVLAFAVFVADDVSFSLGISGIAFALVGYVAMECGLGIEWITVSGGALEWQVGGSAIGIAVMLLYFGRRHYASLLRAAFGGRAGEARGHEVWACRLFLLSMGALVAMLMNLGLDWLLAILTALLFMLGYLVFARINVESGMWLVQSKFFPLAMLVGFFGVKGLGLSAIAMIGFLSVVFAMDIRECLMPMVLNGLQVCRGASVPTGRVAGAGVIVFLIALAAAVPFSLWVDHSYGISGGEGWSTYDAPRRTFDYVAKQYTLLKDENLRAGEGLSGLQRLRAALPDAVAVKAVLAGFAAVILLSVLRLRFRWWPIHPILLVVWGTWGMYETAGAFLVGWAIKKAALGFGVKYAKLKTFMIGVIAGDLAGGALWMILGAIYWARTGLAPPRYHIFPGG